ncbi:hypothetical protein [Cellulophaga fucicola]|uniref:hypothetical protein n=1 Tax=Cellulophaga fucicola TaxID=76595 RepID=UPI003EBA5F6E
MCFSIFQKKIDDEVFYSIQLPNIERKSYYVQAVFNLDLGGSNIELGASNLYSEPIKIDLTKKQKTILLK